MAGLSVCLTGDLRIHIALGITEIYMTTKYDIISIGAGHNGLVAAAYMAKAGKKVLILERNVAAGGGVVTREVTLPGFHHDMHSMAHIMIHANPLMLDDELGLLSKFGLKYDAPDVPHATAFADGTVIFTYKDIDRTAQSIAKVSERDAESYRRFAQASQRMLPLFAASMFSPPPPMSAFVAMMDQSTEGRDIMQMLQRTPLDICNDWFENDKVKMHLLRLISENLLFWDELGAGATFFLWPGLVHTYGIQQPIGGSGALTDALLKCIQHYGGEIQLNQSVAKVVVKDGRATGVEMVDGQRYEAKQGVIGAIHPHNLSKMVEGVDPGVATRGKRVVLSKLATINTSYALNEPLRHKAGPEFDKAVLSECLVWESVEEALDDFDHIKRGRLPKNPVTIGVDPSVRDKSRVPLGKGMMYNTALVPYRLAGHSAAYWDECKEEVADKNLAYLRQFTHNLNSENILARHIDSPLDMERWSPSFMEGDIHGAAPNFFQTIGHRPTADLGQFTVPGVEGLYLVGPFMHPGGGVNGAGRATAMKMLDDMGIEFDKVAAARIV